MNIWDFSLAEVFLEEWSCKRWGVSLLGWPITWTVKSANSSDSDGETGGAKSTVSHQGGGGSTVAVLMSARQGGYKQRYFTEEQGAVFGVWESKKELVFQASFWNKYTDTSDSGREMLLVDQSQDTSGRLCSQVQCTVSFHTLNQKLGWASEEDFTEACIEVRGLLRAMIHLFQLFLQVASEVMLGKQAIQAALLNKSISQYLKVDLSYLIAWNFLLFIIPTPHESVLNKWVGSPGVSSALFSLGFHLCL